MTLPLPLLDRDLLAELPENRAAAVLRHALEHPTPPPHRRIFVNRTLRMETIRSVGFDLDWTLADYERLPIEQLAFELAIDRLIAHHGYPESIRRAEFRPEFPRRGLLIDKQAGTVLRMSRHRYVGSAYLGRRRLERHERGKLYRHEPINPANERFYRLDTLFELPEANLFTELVETGLGRADGSGYRKLFEDVRTAIDWVHAEGDLKPRILSEPERFLRRDPELALALERLALGDRRLVLVTNSDWPYVQGICAYLFDGLLPGLDSWRDLFALVVVSSAKPGFFRGDRPFVALDDTGRELGEAALPDWGKVYRGGSLAALMRLLDRPGEQVLYVGDHIYGDIVSSKLGSTWRTALIVRELEEELEIRDRLTDEYRELARLKRRLAELGHQMDHLHDIVALCRRLEEGGAQIPEELPARTRERFERTQERHRGLRRRATRLSEKIEESFSPIWGSLFKQGSSKSLFASQLETFACLYTSRVSNFAFYGTNHYFRVLEDPMMHEVAGD